MMNFSLKHVAIALAVILFLSFGMNYTDGNTQEQESLNIVSKVAKLYKISGNETGTIRRFPGKVKASNKAVLAFEVPGTLKHFAVNEGQKVKKGDVLAALDAEQYELDVARHQVRLSELKADLSRAEVLLKKGNISKSVFDQRKSLHDQEKIALSEAKRKLRESKIKAPFDGLVAEKYVENHENIAPGQSILMLHDLSTTDISIQVPESIIAFKDKIKEKEGVVSFKVRPDVFYSVVYKEHATEPDPATQTYEVVLTMPRPKDFNPLPGMTAMVEADLTIQDEEKTVDINIPASSIVSDHNGKFFVWQTGENGGKITKKYVELGEFGDDFVEVINGLEAGDTIVAAGARLLNPNIEVIPFKNSSDM